MIFTGNFSRDQGNNRGGYDNRRGGDDFSRGGYDRQPPPRDYNNRREGAGGGFMSRDRGENNRFDYRVSKILDLVNSYKIFSQIF